MHQRHQFGMRENPASDRRHGSRSVTNANETSNSVEEEKGPPNAVAPGERLSSESRGSTNASRPRAATGGEGSAKDWHAFRLALTRSEMDFEPLLGSEQAARLLGHIHVKTLQRYARKGEIPSYRVGGHWYFRASELDSWLRSRLNSSCHPCRLQEKSDGT